LNIYVKVCKGFIECDYCKATFAKDLKFVNHMEEVHEESKPYKCETFEFRFSRKRNMARHILIVHKKKKPFE
jgi:hypothetical protein